mgnify:FL=1
MCRMTEDGYIMQDGTLIRYDSEITNISVKHIKELEEQGKWEHFIIQAKMHCLSEKLEDIPRKVTEMITISIDNAPKAFAKKWMEVAKVTAALLTSLTIILGAIVFGAEIIHKLKNPTEYVESTNKK